MLKSLLPRCCFQEQTETDRQCTKHPLLLVPCGDWPCAGQFPCKWASVWPFRLPTTPQPRRRCRPGSGAAPTYPPRTPWKSWPPASWRLGLWWAEQVRAQSLKPDQELKTVRLGWEASRQLTNSKLVAVAEWAERHVGPALGSGWTWWTGEWTRDRFRLILLEHQNASLLSLLQRGQNCN